MAITVLFKFEFIPRLQRGMNSNKRKDKNLFKAKERCRNPKGFGKIIEIPHNLMEHSGNPASGATGMGILAFCQTERHSRVS